MPPRLTTSETESYVDYALKAFVTTTGTSLTLNPHSPKYTHIIQPAIDGIPICYVPKKIKQNGPATIIFWQDGSKTVIKRAEGDPDGGVYHAFCAALAKKIYKTNSQLKRVIDRKTE